MKTQVACLLSLLLAVAYQSHACQPVLGIRSTLVRVPGHFEQFAWGRQWIGEGELADVGIRGLRVDHVVPRSPAAQRGLERGDIVLYIDPRLPEGPDGFRPVEETAFGNLAAYEWAMRQVGDHAMIGVIDVRSNPKELVWLCYRFRHKSHHWERDDRPQGLVSMSGTNPGRCRLRCALCR